MLFRHQYGRCVCCAQPANTRLFEDAYAPLCIDCLPNIQSTPQRIAGNCNRSIFVYGIYEGILRTIIPKYKYQSAFYYAPLLADMLIFTLRSFIVPQYDYCIPVPQHIDKAHKRGAYHMGILCNYVTRYTGIPTSKTLMRTVVQYTSQQLLSREERLHNVQNAFTVTRSLHGMRILILDDVVTTGSTITEVAETMLESGAEHIDCLAIAIHTQGIIVTP